ncbi:hypothetical protein OH809_11410 [Streptomyces sp. NBC_00873]|uniref:hypothetical protein n=1 Tax=unclassified Streptomyces TaxID=2593676 RepID=UPI00386BB867|nr:hypothetical protein OH809_11410 [Streptomyces sp. NBC_00873]WTA46745.1 hypothetical protein OH821_32395 [Streptomyces sp. NBC_00842]
MAWDEWDQLKAEVAAKRSAAQMQLNQAAASGGSGGGSQKDLVVHNDQLGKLGNLAYALREGLRVDADHARQNTFDASIELFNDGLDMGSALTELHDGETGSVQFMRALGADEDSHATLSVAQQVYGSSLMTAQGDDSDSAVAAGLHSVKMHGMLDQ